jgi:molybdopterin-binding protein
MALGRIIPSVITVLTNVIGNIMPRKEQGWITFQTSEEERKILEEFCQDSQRTKTEILRELVRSLNKHQAPQAPIPTKKIDKAADQVPELEITTQKKPLKVSSRNILKGVVKKVVTGAVNCEVTLEIVHKVELTSMITKTSAEELELAEGEEAYAVIKSNDIVIAKE